MQVWTQTFQETNTWANNLLQSYLRYLFSLCWWDRLLIGKKQYLKLARWGLEHLIPLHLDYTHQTKFIKPDLHNKTSKKNKTKTTTHLKAVRPTVYTAAADDNSLYIWCGGGPANPQVHWCKGPGAEGQLGARSLVFTQEISPTFKQMRHVWIWLEIWLVCNRCGVMVL